MDRADLPAQVKARAWCRVDFAGGTLDIWPLGLLQPESVTVNVAIDCAVRVKLQRSNEGFRVLQGDESVRSSTAVELARQRETSLVGAVLHVLEAPPVEVVVHSDSPRGGGLGASSALTVALIAAIDRINGRPDRSPMETSALARDLEAQLMQLPTGRQDHFPALLGGALRIAHRPGGEQVRKLVADLEALGESLIVVYTGKSHFSAGNNWSIVRRRLDGDHETADRFARIAEIAVAAGEALESGEFDRLGRLMSDEWKQRRELAAGISTPEIEALLEVAGNAGAWGGKACGAGGGGCMAFLAPPEKRGTVTKALQESGALPLPARPAHPPLSVQAG